MMSLTFGLFTQVSGLGPLGPLVLLYYQIHIYFLLKIERSFCTAKASHIFSTKNIGIFEILTFETATSR